METFNIFKIAGMLGLMISLSFSANAQSQFQLTGKPELKVAGGSTLHDWEMVANTATGKAEITLHNQSIQTVKMADVTMKATALKSGKGQMDNIAYKALKASKNPNIHFSLTSFKNLGGNKATATGNLTIAGTTKPVTFQVQHQLKGEAVELKGETTFNMTDFNITPPTAMLGTIKTEGKVTISFKALYNKVK